MSLGSAVVWNKWGNYDRVNHWVWFQNRCTNWRWKERARLEENYKESPLEGQLETGKSEEVPETVTGVDENIETIVKKEKEENGMSRVSSQSRSLPDAVLPARKGGTAHDT